MLQEKKSLSLSTRKKLPARHLREIRQASRPSLSPSDLGVFTAQDLGSNGDFRAWEHLLRIHE
jgi:hypothetical protein